MVNKDLIQSFINYHYEQFNKLQCLKRVFIIWAMSAILYVIGLRSMIFVIMLGFADSAISILFIAIITKSGNTQISRYLCDGIFYFHCSVLLNLASYRVMVFQNGSNWTLALALLGFLLLSITVFTFITISNIKAGKYLETGNIEKDNLLPYLGGALGVFIAPLILNGQSQQIVFKLLSSILLLLSLAMGIGTINLLKLLLYKRCFGN